MTTDQWAWYVARVAAMGAFYVLALAVLTGMAIRTAYLAPLARNRVVLATHHFLTWFWVPLVGAHIVALLFDGAASIGIVDIVIPFRVSFAPGSALAVGLGTCGFLLIVFIGITAALRRRMSPPLWRWLHRLTYPMLGLFLVHAQLAGTDFSRTAVSTIAWAIAGLLVMLALPRLFGGRMSTDAVDDAPAV